MGVEKLDPPFEPDSVGRMPHTPPFFHHQDSKSRESVVGGYTEEVPEFQSAFPDAFNDYSNYHLPSIQPHQMASNHLLDGGNQTCMSNPHVRFQLEDPLVDPPNSLENSYCAPPTPIAILPSQHLTAANELRPGVYSRTPLQDGYSTLVNPGGPMEINAFNLSNFFIPNDTLSTSMAFTGPINSLSPIHQYGDSGFFGNHHVGFPTQYIMPGIPKETPSSTTVTTQDMSRTISTESMYASRPSEHELDPAKLHMGLLNQQQGHPRSYGYHDHEYPNVHSQFDTSMHNHMSIPQEYQNLSSGLNIAPHQRSRQRRSSDSEESMAKDDGISLGFDIQEEKNPFLYEDASGRLVPLKVHINGVTERTVVPVKKKEPEQGTDHVFYRRNYVGATASFAIDVDHAGSLYLQVNGILHQVQATAIVLACQIGQDEGTSVELRLYNTKRKKIDAPPVHRIKTWPKFAVAGIDTDSSSRVLLPHQENGPVGGARSTSAVFERLQFCRATQHNGQRRSNQQYFVLRLECQADIGITNPDGSRQERWVAVHTAKSIEVVVRGRSPGHYNPVKKAAKKEKARQKALEKQRRSAHPADAASGKPVGYHTRQVAAQQQHRLTANYGTREELQRQSQRGKGRGRRGGAATIPLRSPPQSQGANHGFELPDVTSMDTSMFEMQPSRFMWHPE